MQEPTGRHELKHYINYADLLQIRSRLAKVMHLDEHASPDEGYKVRSLYFDNYADKALLEKLDGVDNREKFRLRLYNGDTKLIQLEKKCKSNGLSFKQTAEIPQETCEELLSGEYSSLKQLADPLFVEFYAKLHYQLLRPRTIVEYQREAYMMNAGNARVTLDHHIRSSNQPGHFLTANFPSISLADVCVLEVKFDHFLPELVRAVIAVSSRQSTSISKYAASRLNQE